MRMIASDFSVRNDLDPTYSKQSGAFESLSASLALG